MAWLWRISAVVVTLAGDRLIRSAHDCSDGGLAVALAECAFETGGIGADVSIDGVDVASDARMNVAAALFGESASRVVVSVAPEQAAAALQRATAAGVPARVIGRTGGSRLRITVADRPTVDLAIDEAERAWATAIDRYFEKRVA